ncbi:MAG: 4Fe-4S binding protein [Candidatus Omnitrophota bacterium]|nr:MAG: 4Fe-4S binding protein [Candidatus Omnitrophota bacterium]
MPIKIDYEKCCWKDGKCSSCACGSACIGCVEACSAGALERKMIVEFNSAACVDCGACVDACKYGAISLSS